MNVIALVVPLLLVSTIVLTPQDPPPGSKPTSRAGSPADSRPVAPAGAPALEPVPEPPRSAIERRDLLQRFRAPSRLEGMFKLVAWKADNGQAIDAVAGYLVIGQQHLSLHLQAPGRRADTPLLQSGFRRYRVQGDTLVMTSLVGHRNRENGDIAVEAPGRVEVRRFSIEGVRLRIFHSAAGGLEFVRIE